MNAIAGGRLRACLQFVVAVLFFFVARIFAYRSANALSSDLWAPLVEQLFLAVVLFFGLAGIRLALDGEGFSTAQQGWPQRSGWPREIGLGLLFGWALALVCILPSVFFGGLAITLNLRLASFGWLLVDTVLLALAAFAEEIAFRGYGFQRFLQAVGPTGAALAFAAVYAIVQALAPGSTRASICVAVVYSLILSSAYLRTRALWLSWGLNFGWKASRALLFGMSLNGFRLHTLVVQGDPLGSYWLTGGAYGLESSWITFLLLLAAYPFVYRLTRDLDFRYNTPEIVAAGAPVELQPTAPSPASLQLVQIQPAPASSVANSEPSQS